MGRFQPARLICLARTTVSWPAGASLATVDQYAVAAHMHVGLDDGAVLVGPVVVGRDAARAIVDPLTHRGVTQIGQVVGLGARRKARVLDLDEVADVYVLGQYGTGPQACVGAHQGTCTHGDTLRIAVDVGEGMDDRAFKDAGLTDHAMAADAHTIGQVYLAFKDAVDVDLDVTPAHQATSDVQP